MLTGGTYESDVINCMNVVLASIITGTETRSLYDQSGLKSEPLAPAGTSAADFPNLRRSKTSTSIIGLGATGNDQGKLVLGSSSDNSYLREILYQKEIKDARDMLTQFDVISKKASPAKPPSFSDLKKYKYLHSANLYRYFRILKSIMANKDKTQEGLPKVTLKNDWDLLKTSSVLLCYAWAMITIISVFKFSGFSSLFFGCLLLMNLYDNKNMMNTLSNQLEHDLTRTTLIVEAGTESHKVDLLVSRKELIEVKKLIAEYNNNGSPRTYLSPGPASTYSGGTPSHSSRGHGAAQLKTPQYSHYHSLGSPTGVISLPPRDDEVSIFPRTSMCSDNVRALTDEEKKPRPRRRSRRFRK